MHLHPHIRAGIPPAEPFREPQANKRPLTFDGSLWTTGLPTILKKSSRSFMAASPFPIEYIRQENGGKQRAHNTGVAHCENELFFCVDSDDVLPPHVTEEIERQWSDAASDRRIAGLVGLCGGRDGKPLGTSMPKGVSTLTFWDRTRIDTVTRALTPPRSTGRKS